MADKTIKIRLIPRHDTEANWKTADPVLLAGELGFSTDKNNMFKVGDGKSKWSTLSYCTALKDSAGQQIDTTYIKSLSISGKTITYTKGDGTTGTITTQDTNTWRGIQNNLTSTATDQSLSAAQGKILNEKFASYVPTSRTVNGKALSANISLSASDVGASASGHTHRRISMVGSDAASTNGWYKVADQTFSGYGDSNILFAITSTYANYFVGILSLQMRSDNTKISCGRLSWLARSGFAVGDVIVNISGMKMTLYVNQKSYQYGRIQFEIISESSINGTSSGLTLYNTSTKESTTPTATVTASDGSTVNYANSAGAVAWDNISGKPSTFTPATHNHNYAGSSSAGGSATSAVKLDTTTAGSATQPVYFKDGKPVATTYTLAKSVPADAKFTDTNTWTALKGATTSAAGTAGYAPAPSAGEVNRYLRSDGTWAVPPDNNTTYSNFVKSGSGAKAGLVPAPSTTAGTTKYLREDGTWVVPPNTTYSAATTSTNGLMSSADKTKLDGIATGANKYTHPSYAAKASGFYKVTVDATGHVSATTAVEKADITNLGIPASNTWRGIQDNLISTATDQSLSAKQGKLLKGYIDANSSEIADLWDTVLQVAGDVWAEVTNSDIDAIFG